MTSGPQDRDTRHQPTWHGPCRPQLIVGHLGDPSPDVSAPPGLERRGGTVKGSRNKSRSPSNACNDVWPQRLALLMWQALRAPEMIS